MNINQQRLVSDFVTLVSIDSKSFTERQVGDFIKERLVKLGFAVSEDDAEEKLNGN
jgi:tripeptide aminopeptidase